MEFIVFYVLIAAAPSLQALPDLIKVLYRNQLDGRKGATLLMTLYKFSASNLPLLYFTITTCAVFKATVGATVVMVVVWGISAKKWGKKWKSSAIVKVFYARILPRFAVKMQLFQSLI